MSDAITATDLIREVRAVAEERPHFVYADQEGYDRLGVGCSYVGPVIGNRDGEGCIVGQALSRLGFDMEGVAQWETSAESDNGSGVSDLIGKFEIPANYDQAKWLDRVQVRQDVGDSWGEAVRYADEL